MKRYDFNSFDEFEESGIAGEDEVLTVVHENGWWKGDMTTACKSWKTALRRFFKAMNESEIKDYWFDDMYETFDDGYMREGDIAEGMLPTFCYEIDHLDDNLWYIFLNFDEEFHLGEA